MRKAVIGILLGGLLLIPAAGIVCAGEMGGPTLTPAEGVVGETGHDLSMRLDRRGEGFAFMVTADMRYYAGPGQYDTPNYFRGAVEAIATLGGGDFMVTPGDDDPPDGVLWTIEQVLGSDYTWYPVVGNHELPGEGQEDYYGANLDWLNSYDYGSVNAGPTGCPITTYSFDYGKAHFVMLDEYCDSAGQAVTTGDVPDHLYEWLENDLNSTDQEYIFVFGHEPAYPQPDADNGRIRHVGDSLDQYPQNRDRFWGLLGDKGVAAYICGHTHNYSVVEVDGVWQVDVGHARGMGDTGACSTFVVMHVADYMVTYETYRDDANGGPYVLVDGGRLWPEVFCVDPGGGGDYTDLQAALTAAESSSDTVVIKVAQGTYNGNFSYSSDQGYSITLQGGYTPGCASREIDPANTVLDAGGTGRVLFLNDTSGGDITVDGFTVQHGNASGRGGGVYSSSSHSGAHPAGAVTLTNNIVTGNSASDNGGGIVAYAYAESGDAGTITLANNIVTGNSASVALGGGVCADSYTTAGGGGGTITCTNNTIAANDAFIGGGVFLRIASSSGGIVYAYNNIVWENTATIQGEDIHLNKGTGTAYGYNNDYDLDSGGMYGSWDYGVGTNVDADPLFVDVSDPDPANWDLHLQENSPCVNAGTDTAPQLPTTDFEGDARIIHGAPDMGADEARIIPVPSTSSFLCPSGLGFGEVQVDDTLSLDLIINNTTGSDINVDPIPVGPSAPYSIIANNCDSVTLHPGDTCSIRVQFAPVSTGTFYDSFDIPTDDPEAGIVTVALSGIGIPGTLFEPRGSTPSGPGATVAPDSSESNSMGDVTPAPPPLVEGTSSASSSTGTTPVGAPESPSVVEYTTPGPASQLMISSLPPDMLSEPDKQLLLEEELEPFDSMVFGEIQVGASDQLRIIFSHEQGAAIHMGDIIIPSDPYIIVEDKCSGTHLGSGVECAVTVQFAPPSAQNFNDYFLIPTNDPQVGTLRINLEGMGVLE